MTITTLIRTAMMASGLLAATSLASIDSLLAQVQPYGGMFIQAKKYFGPSPDLLTQKDMYKNLDHLSAGANIGLTYANEHFSSDLNIYAYPPGYGYSVLTNATYQREDSSVATETSDLPGVDILNAWVKFSTPLLDIKVGHMLSYQSNSSCWMFGDYLDEDPVDASYIESGDFQYRGAVSNALELSKTVGISSTSIALLAGDKELNTGMLRIIQDIRPNDNLWLSLGWRINCFDRVQDKEAILQNRIAATIGWSNENNYKVYAEPAVILSSDSAVDTRIPILLGVQVPAGKVFDFVALESEILPNRVTVDGPETEDTRGFEVKKPVLLYLHGERSVGEFGLFDAAIYNDPKGPEFGDLGFALRFTAFFGPQP